MYTPSCDDQISKKGLSDPRGNRNGFAVILNIKCSNEPDFEHLHPWDLDTMALQRESQNLSGRGAFWEHPLAKSTAIGFMPKD